MNHFGVDLSSNNPHPINWPALHDALAGLGGGAQPFVIIKATQGTGYENPYFAADVAAAQAAGFAVGAYLMDQGNADVAAEEGFYRRVAGGLPQFNDDELPMGNQAYAQHCAQLVGQDPQALDYLNQSEAGSGYPDGDGLWLACYCGNPTGPARPCLIHQYTSTGQIAGVGGQVDLDCFLGSEAQFAAIFHLTPAPPAISQEDDMIFVKLAPGEGVPIPVDPGQKVTLACDDYGDSAALGTTVRIMCGDPNGWGTGPTAVEKGTAWQLDPFSWGGPADAQIITVKNTGSLDLSVRVR